MSGYAVTSDKPNEDLYVEGNQSNRIHDSELAEKTNRLVIAELSNNPSLNLENNANLIAFNASYDAYQKEGETVRAILHDLVWIVPYLGPVLSAGITAWDIFSERPFNEKNLQNQLDRLQGKIDEISANEHQAKLYEWKAQVETAVDSIKKYANRLNKIHDEDTLIKEVNMWRIDDDIKTLSTSFYEIVGYVKSSSGEPYTQSEYYFAQAALSIAQDIYLHVLVLSTFIIKQKAILGFVGTALSETGLFELEFYHSKFGNEYGDAMNNFIGRVQSSLKMGSEKEKDFVFVEWRGRRETPFDGMAQVKYFSTLIAGPTDVSQAEYTVTTRDEQKKRKLKSGDNIALDTYEYTYIYDCVDGYSPQIFYDAEIEARIGPLNMEPRIFGMTYDKNYGYAFRQEYFDGRRRVLNTIIQQKQTLYNEIIEHVNNLIAFFEEDLAPPQSDLSNIKITFTNDHPDPNTYWARADEGVQYGFEYLDSLARRSELSWTVAIPCEGRGGPIIPIPVPDDNRISAIRIFRKFTSEQNEQLVATHVRDQQTHQFPPDWTDDFEAKL